MADQLYNIGPEMIGVGTVLVLAEAVLFGLLPHYGSGRAGPDQ